MVGMLLFPRRFAYFARIGRWVALHAER